MPKFNEVIDLNNQAAAIVAEPGSRFDETAADLVLRNTAIIATRLTAHEFSVMSASSIDAVLDVAGIAKELTPPPTPENELQLPHESYSEHQYRLNVWQPLHSLQKKVITGAYDRNDSEIDKLKTAVTLASVAFAATLRESVHNPTIVDTEIYFRTNAEDAVRHARQL